MDNTLPVVIIVCLCILGICGMIFGEKDKPESPFEEVDSPFSDVPFVPPPLIEKKGASRMESIYKWVIDFPKKLPKSETIDVTENTIILSAKKQGNDIVIFGVVKLPKLIPEKKELEVRLVGTGNALKENFSNEFRFIDTLLFNDDSLVVHVHVER